jgi:calcineurin-like phosphoesterase family protein
MNNALIHNWNSVVGVDDEVYHHGDLAFEKNVSLLVSMLHRLNGKIHFIMGNHDQVVKNEQTVRDRFVWVKDYFELKHNGQLFVMCHFPLLTWNKAHRGALHTHGHCHGSIDRLNIDTPRIDVGVDPQGYFPQDLDSIRTRLAGNQYTPVDHHGDM